MTEIQKKRINQILAFLEEDSSDPFLHYALAQEYLGINETGKAIIKYEELVTAHTEYLPTYYQYGLILFETGHLEKSRQVLLAGKELAEQQGNQKTLNEISELLEDVEDELD